MRINYGCGKNIIDGWTNVDRTPGDGIVCADWDEGFGLDQFELDSVDEFLFSHVLEHCRHPLLVMQLAWRFAKPDAICIVKTPYGSSDDAWTDPTHVRPYFVTSWGYFGQPHYWRANYGYQGDWRAAHIKLIVSAEHFRPAMPPEEIFAVLNAERNCVLEMEARLVAVKPRREALAELQTSPTVELAIAQ